MTSRLNPYISFRDSTRSAMTFYQSVFGGELTISTFGDFGAAPEGTDPDLVMHSILQTPLGFAIMASDVPPFMEFTPGASIRISVSGDDADDLRGYFAALFEGGAVEVPMEKQAWGGEFGMGTDRFGIGWRVNITQSDR
jgi:PhnB protein